MTAGGTPDATNEWRFDAAEATTARVAQRIGTELEKTSLEFLKRHFGSLLYNAAQKLIDLKAQTRQQKARHEAVILSCPRLFNECFAGLSLASQGLVLPSVVMLRAATETTLQAILFMENDEMARTWLKGKRIEPKTIREKCEYAKRHVDTYKHLSRLAHPNAASIRYYSVVSSSGDRVGAFYGGGYFPKNAGLVSIQFLYAQLGFLEAFYTIFHDELVRHNLLWRPRAIEATKQGGTVTWVTYLAGMRRLVDQALETVNSWPDDEEDLSAILTSVGE